VHYPLATGIAILLDRYVEAAASERPDSTRAWVFDFRIPALLSLPDLVLIGKNVHSPVSVVKIIAQWRKMIGGLIFGVGVVVVLSPQHVLHLLVA
jgi:hypothetical protein